MNILATKILSDTQKELLKPLEVSFMEYEAISISYRAFDVPQDFDYFLITSQNAVRSLMVHLKSASDSQHILTKSAFCVGSKTALLLGRTGLYVDHFEDNASLLGKYLVEHHPNHTFLFLCGDKRREELPVLLNKNSIAFKERIVYDTSLNPVALDTNYDAYLFFSPSAVKSFAMKNKPEKGIVYCIGHTTAEAAKNLKLPIRISESPTVESVLDLVIQNLKKRQQK
ncbi:MAG: uroporphyrinogen-III synthase [Eudoraea sp.]|nr:uroporphyrinogen-III synthase [Eudoraea sp.]